MRLRRACVLLEVIDDDTGQLTAIGYDLAASVASIDFDHRFSMDFDSRLFSRKRPTRYNIQVSGPGREFHVDLGTWFDTPPPQELNPATPEIDP